VALLAEDTEALPHLGAALARHLRDLPDGATGLSTTEALLLEALRPGPLDRRALKAAIDAQEARPWLTDVLLDEIVARLGGGSAPLLAAPQDGPVALTRRGHDVLGGCAVWTAERWHGGIYIGRDPDVATLN
jgi:hypothetical protein